MDVGFIGAFVGGLLSLLSPCSVMLLPAFFAYAFSDPKTLIARTGVFYLGLLTTLVPLGVFAGTVGVFLTTHRQTFLTIVGSLVIVFGLIQVLGIQMPSFGRKETTSDPGTIAAVYALGAAYGVAGACTGPILASVLMVAAAGASPLYGAILLALYAAGMAAPLMLLALLWKRWSHKLRAFLMPREVRIGRWRNSWHALISGALSVVLGAVLVALAPDPEAAGLVPIDVQYQVESTIQQFGSSATNLIALGIAAVFAIAAITLWMRQSNKRRSSKTAKAPSLDEPTQSTRE